MATDDDAPPSQPTPGSRPLRRNRIRNQTRRDSILRGLRTGGLLATAMAGIAGAWARRGITVDTELPEWLRPDARLIPVLILLASAIWIATSMLPERKRRLFPGRSILAVLLLGMLLVVAACWSLIGLMSVNDISLILILAILAPIFWAAAVSMTEDLRTSPRGRHTTIAVITILLGALPSTGTYLLGRSWWQQSQDIGLPYPVLWQYAVAVAGLGVGAVAGVLLHATTAGTYKERRHMLRLPHTGRTSTITMSLTVGIAVIALMAPSQVYVSQSVQVPVTDGQPVPETLGNHFAWQRVFDRQDEGRVHGVIPGSVGPIVITEHGAQGLDPSTGETTWSYHREAQTTLLAFNSAPCDEEEQAHCHAALSPDRTHLVIVYAGAGGDLFVSLNTTTGEVAFERTVTDWRDREVPIQITDHIVTAGTELLSLTDGSVVAELPDHDTGSDQSEAQWPKYVHSSDPEAPRVYSPFLQGGHSTLILGVNCSDLGIGSEYATWCEITVAPDTDPEATRTVEGIVPVFEDWDYTGIAIADGWTVRYSDPAAVHESLGTRFGTDSLGYSIEAVNLDALSGVDADAQPVTLGDSDRPIPPNAASTLGIRDPEAYAYRFYRPALSAVFDPMTEQVHSAGDLTEQATGRGYLDTLVVEKSVDYSGLDVLDLNEKVVLHLSLSQIASPEDFATANDTPLVSNGYLVPAPGTVALVYERLAVDSAKHPTKEQIVVCGLA
ncbi:hypothetical protein [Actinomyces glycerinitolerans]|uniref:Uncharacterized protein n=1 Tax=Actinomyces glycerinitolerans TaxID=1892869 RepID=A0A1M4RY69_9ACTO|nr:hypothetical protein [Actinomyces glycerinitolerans]SHE24935.1 Hypothetical protein ACGLYG10_1147 [Actinomyces glycerinitolerans]